LANSAAWVELLTSPSSTTTANTLLMAKQMMEQAAARGDTRLPDEQVSFIRSAYAGALSVGRQANAGKSDTKGAKLVERFVRDAADILRFTTDTAIWFSNNQSERDLRPTKLQQKISGTWRTLQGLADFATLRSYLSTATKHGMDLLDVLQRLFTTGPWLPPAPAAISS
jgi:transposase